MRQPKAGDRIMRDGREYRYIEAGGWWQVVLTDEERRIIASGETPPGWEPTEEGKEAAQRKAEELLGGRDRSRPEERLSA